MLMVSEKSKRAMKSRCYAYARASPFGTKRRRRRNSCARERQRDASGNEPVTCQMLWHGSQSAHKILIKEILPFIFTLPIMPHTHPSALLAIAQKSVEAGEMLKDGFGTTFR